MLRVLLPVSPALFFLVAACGGATRGWRPSISSSHVPDSTLVRIAVQESGLRMSGRAIDWQRGTPKVVTTRGDTMIVPDGARLEARIKGRTNGAAFGSVVGYLIGVVVTFNRCGGIDAECSEKDPASLLTLGAGALIGSLFKPTLWVTVRRDTLTLTNPPGT